MLPVFFQGSYVRAKDKQEKEEKGEEEKGGYRGVVIQFVHIDHVI